MFSYKTCIRTNSLTTVSKKHQKQRSQTKTNIHLDPLQTNNLLHLPISRKKKKNLLSPGCGKRQSLLELTKYLPFKFCPHVSTTNAVSRTQDN